MLMFVDQKHRIDKYNYATQKYTEVVSFKKYGTHIILFQ